MTILALVLLGAGPLTDIAAEEYDLDIEIDLGSLDMSSPEGQGPEDLSPEVEEIPAAKGTAEEGTTGEEADREEANRAKEGAPGAAISDIPAAVFSRAERPLSLYGYLVNYSTANLYSSGHDPAADLGNVLYLRLKGDAEPEDFLQFHFELSYSGSTGNQNFYALMDDYGLIAADPEAGAEKNPYEDLVQEIELDHLWGSVSLALLDLQFGKIPLAWGTGYVFNPTSRAAGIAFMDTVAEETPGTLAVSAGFQLPRYYSLQGYVAFQDKYHNSGYSLEDGAFDNLPWGWKITGLAGAFDFSFGMVKEVIRAGEGDYLRAYYGTGDFVGALGPFGVYGEAAAAFPGGNSFSLDFQGWDPLSSLEASAGFDYEFDNLEITLRGEYYYYGPGTADPDKYDNSLVLSGAAQVLGRDYCFLNAERTFFDYLSVAAGTLINLHDYSAIILPEMSYEIASDFTVSAGSFLFYSGKSGEFGGDYGPLPVDLTTSAVFLRVKLSF